MSSEAITRNDLANILDDVLPSVAVDYIVEQATNANGRYRKWADGLIEQWGNYSVSANSGYASITLPTSFTDTTYGVIASVQYISGIPTFSVSYQKSTSSTMIVYIRTGANGTPTSATNISVYCWGY